MSQLAHTSAARRQRARLGILLLLLLVTMFSVGWAPDPQTQLGTVSGEVVNGTPGENVPNDLAVSLHVFSGTVETDNYTTTVGGGGSYLFADVAFEEQSTVVARAVYEGVTYVSEFATVEPEQEEISLPVMIYETTEDAADVAITQLHVFVNQMGERVQVGEYAVLANTGSRTYVGASDEGVRTTWSTRLPQGAENLQFESGDLGGRFIPLDDGFADTRPIPPGGSGVETSFTYEIAFREGLEIEQLFDVPVRSAVLVLPEGDWGLQGTGISAEGMLDTQMGPALSYTAGPLSAGEPLAFSLSARPSADTVRPVSERPGGLAFGIAAFVAAGVVVTLMWRPPSPSPMPAKVRAQVEALAALDSEFETGRLSEEAYREKRRSLKQRLRNTLSD